MITHAGKRTDMQQLPRSGRSAQIDVAHQHYGNGYCARGGQRVEKCRPVIKRKGTKEGHNRVNKQQLIDFILQAYSKDYSTLRLRILEAASSTPFHPSSAPE